VLGWVHASLAEAQIHSSALSTMPLFFSAASVTGHQILGGQVENNRRAKMCQCGKYERPNLYSTLDRFAITLHDTVLKKVEQKYFPERQLCRLTLK
jgi:hypothetical protein